MSKIVALGELLVDMTAAKGEENVFRAHPGGAPANFLAAAAAAGAKTEMIAKVGDDMFGALLCSALSDAGVGTAGVLRDPSVFTTLAFVHLDNTGERRFSFARKPGADTCLRFEETDLSLLDDAGLLHFGTLSLTDEPAKTATEKTVTLARAKGIPTSFDPNYRPPLWRTPQAAREAIFWGVSNADVIKLSEEEAYFLFGEAPAAAAARLLRETDCRLVFVTLGKSGVYYAARDFCGAVENYDGVRTVDTTGAGDIFGGSAAALLLRTGLSPDRAQLEVVCRYACTAASLSTGMQGGISSVPSKESVLQILEKNGMMETKNKIKEMFL